MEIAVTLLVLNLLPIFADADLPNGECSAQNMTCPFDDNFIDILREITSAEECKQECENSVDCNVYTYPGTSPGGVILSNTCNLFMDCLELKPITGSCLTEEVRCDDGTTTTTTMTTTSTASTTITTTAATDATSTTTTKPPPEWEYTGQTLPYPDSCRKYYYCLQDGTTHVFDCCPGVYDPITDACVAEEEGAELCTEVEDNVCR